MFSSQFLNQSHTSKALQKLLARRILAQKKLRADSISPAAILLYLSTKAEGSTIKLPPIAVEALIDQCHLRIKECAHLEFIYPHLAQEIFEWIALLEWLTQKSKNADPSH